MRSGHFPLKAAGRVWPYMISEHGCNAFCQGDTHVTVVQATEAARDITVDEIKETFRRAAPGYKVLGLGPAPEYQLSGPWTQAWLLTYREPVKQG